MNQKVYLDLQSTPNHGLCPKVKGNCWSFQKLGALNMEPKRWDPSHKDFETEPPPMFLELPCWVLCRSRHVCSLTLRLWLPRRGCQWKGPMSPAHITQRVQVPKYQILGPLSTHIEGTSMPKCIIVGYMDPLGPRVPPILAQPMTPDSPSSALGFPLRGDLALDTRPKTWYCIAFGETQPYVSEVPNLNAR